MGQGDARVSLTDTNGCQQNIILKNAPYVPSFSQFGKSSAQLQFHGTAFDIFKDGQLYFLKSSFVSKTSSHMLQEWHNILGHCNKADILKLENSVDGMIITDKSDFDCEVCALGKMTDNRSRQPYETAKQPLDVVHIDLAGPVEPEDTNGMKYSLVYVDSLANITSVYFTKQKSNAVQAFKQHRADISPYGKVKTVKSDQGGEFISKEFSSLLVENKIKHEKTAPYSPQQNGKAERTWRSLFETSRCLLLQSGLPKTLWTYATMTAAYIRNRCCNKNINCTPLRAWQVKSPTLQRWKHSETLVLL